MSVEQKFHKASSPKKRASISGSGSSKFSAIQIFPQLAALAWAYVFLNRDQADKWVSRSCDLDFFASKGQFDKMRQTSLCVVDVSNLHCASQ